MISKKDILKMARNITKRSSGVTASKPVHPRREWLIGVSLFVIISIVGGMFTAVNYVKYNNLDSNIESIPPTVTIYKSSNVAAALEYFEQRKIAFDGLLESAPVYVTSLENEEGATSTATTTVTAVEGEDGESGEEVESGDLEEGTEEEVVDDEIEEEGVATTSSEVVE